VPYSNSSVVDVPESVMHGWCNARPTVTFPAAQCRHCPMASIHFPCSWG